MAKYSCIAIGINQYQFLQPLSCAQADAFDLRQFLVKHTNLSPQQCLLLTDVSPWVERKSTHPTKENILSWLEKSDTSSGAGNICWFLFSGYGVNWQGEDYLIPIDGNPQDIPQTAISVRSLLTTLKKQGEGNILVLLDMNRSPGIFSGASVGAQTVALAREMGMALVLSTQVNEYSHESASLGRGFFTEALLEALGYYGQDLTLEVLENYLRYRLPEIGEHHWRPAQTPIIITPSIQASKGKLLPGTEEIVSWYHNSNDGTNNSYNSSTEAVGNSDNHHQNGTGRVNQTGVLDVEEVSQNGSQSPSHQNNGSRSSSAIIFKPKPPQPKSKNWSELIFWGGGAALAAALVVAAVAIANQDGKGKESYAQTQGQVIPTIPSNPEVTDGSPVIPPNPQVTISAAQSPNNSEPTTPSSSEKPLAPVPNAPLQATNQGILKRARTYIQTNQASGFNRAINEVRKIQPGQPLYEEAQGDIIRWSQVILDIAQGRANQGDFGGAIAAAKLVPQDQQTTYSQAQGFIQQWTAQGEQQKNNQLILQGAKEQIRPNQASSYNQAINTLKRIPKGQAGYEQGQNLTNQWSRQIYLIANSRAARGNFAQAINAAALVPQSTPSYQQAQQAIARWQKGQR